MQQTMTGGPELPFSLHAIHSTSEGLYIMPDVLKLNYRSLNYAARDRERARVRAGETIVWENAKICIQQVAAHFKWPWSWRPKLAQHACCSPPSLSLSLFTTLVLPTLLPPHAFVQSWPRNCDVFCCCSCEYLASQPKLFHLRPLSVSLSLSLSLPVSPLQWVYVNLYACLWDESGRGRLDKFFYSEQTKFHFFFLFLALDNFIVVLLFYSGNAANKMREGKKTNNNQFCLYFCCDHCRANGA